MQYKKIIKLFIFNFILFFALFNVINSASIVVNNGFNESTYVYNISNATAPQLECQNTEQKLIIQNISIYSSFGSKIFNNDKQISTRCEDLTSTNNMFGIIKVYKVNDNDVNNARHVDLTIISITALILAGVITLIITILCYTIKLNKFIYTQYSNKHDLFILIQMLLFFGMFSLIYGQDVNWDLKNYHYYNGWAFLNNRINTDITPNNGLHGYFSPILDSIQYLSLHYLPAVVYAFFAGCISGCAAFICYKLNKLIFSIIQDKKLRKTIVLYSTILSITGVANIIQVGTVTNENIVALLLIWSIYLLIRFYANYSFNVISVIGVLIGIALGFKLTAVIIVIPLCILFASYNLKEYKHLIIFFVSIICAFLIIDGLWMYKMYQMFGNPIYPNFGKYINPTTALDFQRDTTFIPKDLMHWLFLPFYLFVSNKLTGEIAIADMRFGFAMMSIMLVLIVPRYRNILKNKNIKYYILIFIASYMCWIALFAIQRYTIVLEYLSGGLILMPFMVYDKITNKIKFVMTSLMFIIIFTTHYSSLGHISYNGKFYSSNVSVKNSLVIFNVNPAAYIAPELGSSNVYMNAPDFQFTSKFDQDRKIKLLQHTIDINKNIFIIVNNPLENVEWIVAYKLLLDDRSCEKFNKTSNLYVCKLMH